MMKWKKGLIVEGGRHLAWHVNDPCLKSPGDRGKRPRSSGNRGRYGSVDGPIADAMNMARNSVHDCQRALAVLEFGSKSTGLKSPLGKCSPIGTKITAIVPVDLEDDYRVYQTVEPLQSRPGETADSALDLQSDGEDMPSCTPRRLMKGSICDAFNAAEGLAPAVSCMSPAESIMEILALEQPRSPGDDIMEILALEQPRSPGDDIMEILALEQPRSSGDTSMEILVPEQPRSPGDTIMEILAFEQPRSPGKDGVEHIKSVTPRKPRKQKHDDSEDMEVEDTPKVKKAPKLAYLEVESEGPDYELEENSASDSEDADEIVDPLADYWKEFAIMACKEKPEPVLDETPNGHCIHTLVIMPDLGRTCTQCGLVTERIEHMSFIYHAPRYLRNPSSKGRKAQDPYCSIPDGEELQESLLTMSALEVHPSLEDRMHPHQLEGFKFLSRNLVEEDGGGCMLAFAPGTGKSFLVISFIQSFLVQMPDAKPLIVAPKGMLLPWVREFKKWEVQEITTFNLYEAQSCVDSQLSMLHKWQQQERSVLLVGYSQFVNMTGEVGRLLTEGPGLLILDEGHLARTKDTKILKSLMQVRTKRRVLLSGTPFNNNFDEFYNTLELVRPGFMQRASALLSPVANALEPFWSETVTAGSIPSPTKKSGNVGRQAFKDVIVERIESGTPAGILTALKQLRILISPFVAWHKGQILETLPGISDFTIMLHLTPAQKHSLALAEKHDIRDNLQKGPAAIYVHPILEQVGEKKRSQDDLRLQENVNVKDGAKLRWVTDLMELCDAAGEKLLIFSEYLYSLALIENVIAHRMGWGKGLQILRIDGKTHLLEREKIVKSFNEGQDARVLCASIKACGEGISLVGASRVVLLEVPWNPAVARQAISRAFRIGQKKKVVVYRLIAADTQEEKNMHESSTRKEWLSRLLFDQSIGNSHTSILWDVTGKCSDRFLDQGPLMEGVRNVLEREF